MTLITFEDGKVVFRDGAVGTEQACCCGEDEPCSGPCVVCEGACQWTNDPDFDEFPPVNGWYLIFGCDDEENCQCLDPAGQPSPYDFEDPEGSVETTASGCVTQNAEDACVEGCVCVDGQCVENPLP